MFRERDRASGRKHPHVELSLPVSLSEVWLQVSDTHLASSLLLCPSLPLTGPRAPTAFASVSWHICWDPRRHGNRESSLYWGETKISLMSLKLRKSLFIDHDWQSRLMTRLEKTKIPFCWQTTKQLFLRILAVTVLIFQLYHPWLLVPLTPQGITAASGCLEESSFKEMQNEKYSALKSSSISSSYDCGGDYPASRSCIHFSVAGTSCGYSGINLDLWQAASGRLCSGWIFTASSRLPACCFFFFSDVSRPQWLPVGSEWARGNC